MSSLHQAPENTNATDPRLQPEQGAPPSAIGDLPPVEPPTAGFIVQLFVIPAVVVAVVIAVWLLFGKMAGGERDAMDYVEAIRSENESRRWRAAHELASLIGNDQRLARDPNLLAKLTELLNQELDQPGDARLKLYLVVALGAFQVAGPGPATGGSSAGSRADADPLATLARALGPKQDTSVRLAAAESLAQQAARHEGTLDDPALIDALAQASEAAEPELRKRATFALGFLGGERVAERLRQRLKDEDREVRYNAAIALGRRGDPTALPLFREMLSPQDLGRVIRLPNEAETRSQVERITLTALRALQTSVRAGQPTLAQLLRRDVTPLTRSPLAGVRMEAEALLKVLPPSPASPS